MSDMILHGAALVTLISFVLFWLSYEYYELKTKVPVFPSMPRMRSRIIERLKADSAASTGPYAILDLGSGSGQMTWHVARALPETRVVGVEFAYIPWLRSVMRQRLWGPPNLSYIRADFWGYDVSPFQAVITYLPGKIMEEVGAKLHRELRPGALVLANIFPLRDGWLPVDTETVCVPFKTKLFVYRQTGN